VSGASDDIVVRAVGKQDLSAVAGLWRSMRLGERSFRNPEMDLETASDDLSPFYDLAARRSREPDTVLLIAYRGGGPVGFYCGQVRGHVGRGNDLYVTPPARRSGVGRLLVRAALAQYRARGADRLVGSLPGDEGLRAFWESIWKEHPFRLVSTRSTEGMEWRTRSIAIDSEGGTGHRGQGQPAGQSNS
jgi:GNAT superfamily N-acetyltransferase